MAAVWLIRAQAPRPDVLDFVGAVVERAEGQLEPGHALDLRDPHLGILQKLVEVAVVPALVPRPPIGATAFPARFASPFQDTASLAASTAPAALPPVAR